MNAVAKTIPFPNQGNAAEVGTADAAADRAGKGHQLKDIFSKLDYLLVEQEERVRRRHRDAERQAERRGYRLAKADWRYRMAQARLQDLRDVRDFLQQEHGV